VFVTMNFVNMRLAFVSHRGFYLNFKVSIALIQKIPLIKFGKFKIVVE
jgi:hypothetical protein